MKQERPVREGLRGAIEPATRAYRRGIYMAFPTPRDFSFLKTLAVPVLGFWMAGGGNLSMDPPILGTRLGRSVRIGKRHPRCPSGYHFHHHTRRVSSTGGKLPPIQPSVSPPPPPSPQRSAFHINETESRQ